MSELGAIEEYSVDGVPLLLVQDRSLPVVRFYVALREGSVADPMGRSGLTRLFMNMSLRGTEAKNRVKFNEELERMGSSISPMTGAELALWRGNCLRRNLQATWDLLVEALSSPAMQADEFDLLKTEAIEVLRVSRDEDGEVAEHFSRKILYKGHPFERSPSGKLSELQATQVAELKPAFKRRVWRKNLVVAMAGDISTTEAQALVKRLLASLPEEGDRGPEIPVLTDPRGHSITLIDKPDRSQAQLRLMTPTLSGLDEERYAFWLGAVAFGGTFTSPFTRKIRDEKGWSYVAAAAFRRRQRGRIPLTLYSAPAQKDLVECLDTELSLFNDLSRGELDVETIDFARTYLLNRYPLEMITATDKLVPALSNLLMGVRPHEVLEIPEKLAVLSPDEIPGVLSKHLESNRLHTVIVASASDVLDDLKAHFKDVEIEVVDYRSGLEEEDEV